MGTYISLESLEVASPCHADWTRMRGDERARFCGSCEKHVYNVADMTRAEAEALIRSHEDGVCMRLMRRADGTVITGDCPIGTKIARRSLTWTRSAAALVCLPLVALAMSAISAGATTLAQPVAAGAQGETISLEAERPLETEPIVMGLIACPPPEVAPEPEPAPEPSPEPAPTETPVPTPEPTPASPAE